MNFIDGLKETEVWDILDEHSLRGTRISTLINRYAVEVPDGKEQHFVNIFKETSGVKSVHYTPKEKNDKTSNSGQRRR